MEVPYLPDNTWFMAVSSKIKREIEQATGLNNSKI